MVSDRMDFGGDSVREVLSSLDSVRVRGVSGDEFLVDYYGGLDPAQESERFRRASLSEKSVEGRSRGGMPPKEKKADLLNKLGFVEALKETRPVDELRNVLDDEVTRRRESTSSELTRETLSSLGNLRVTGFRLKPLCGSFDVDVYSWEGLSEMPHVEGSTVHYTDASGLPPAEAVEMLANKIRFVRALE